MALNLRPVSRRMRTAIPTTERKPLSVERARRTDGPPERAGAPEADAEDEPDQSSGKQSDGRFAGIALVAEAEEDGEDDGPTSRSLKLHRDAS